MRRLAVLTLLLPLLSACAEGASIYHMRSVNSAQPAIVTVDAKQRSLIVNNSSQVFKVCAEAAPDVFSAINAAASLEADVKGQSGKAGFSMAETAAALERTQTVNMLRERMYRTCELYINGGIGKPQLMVQIARDQRMMIKTLAIEQLTRTARPPATIISAAAVSANVVDGETVAGLIRDFAAERKTAKGALDTAIAAYVAAKTTGKCDSVTAAPADDSGDPKLTDWSNCKAAEAEKASKQSEFDTASARLDKALAVSDQLSSGVASAAQSGPISTGAGGEAVNAAAIKAIATAVENIVYAPDIDESLMFCISFLGSETQDEKQAILRDPDTAQACRKVITDRAARDDTLGKANFQKVLSQPVLLDLNTYLSNPKGPGAGETAERKRRIALTVKAARDLGLSLDPPDIAMLASGAGDISIIRGIVSRLSTLETNSAARADLKLD